MKDNTIYRVLFRQDNEIYEIYARHVYQGNLHGFVEIENILYGERTKLVDPADEKIRAEFKDAKRSYIPHFNIIRIDEVAKQGVPRIHRSDNQILLHPHGPKNADEK